MGYTFYEPLKVWLDPASITDVVAYIQTYLAENPISDEEDIENIVAEYIAAHPELIGGVQSVNGETGEVVLTASDINTSGSTTIQAVLTSLTGQISEIVQTITGLDTRITTNATGITNEATARANADTALGNRITALQGAVGSPLIAATAAAMTDTSKIYVYTGSETGYTNGNWYYYNGSAWVSGGVYNAVAINTDTTLTVAGMAADAKATGDGLNDLKSNLDYTTDSADSPSSDWEQGVFQVSNGTKSSSTTRLRTATTDGVNENVISASCKTNYQALMFCWSGSTYLGVFQNDSFVKVNATWATSFDLSKARSLGATIIKFQFRKTDNSTLTATDGKNFVYTTVSLGIKNRVEKLESDILQTTANSPSVDWEQGALQVSNGTTTSNNARIRTVSNGIGNSVVMASCTDGYQGFLCCYANGSYIGIYEDGIFKKENVSWASSWNLEDARSAGADVFRLVVKRTDGADLLPSEGANILYTTAKDMLLSLYKDRRYLSGCYKGKRISILGDSISTYGGSVSDPANERFSPAGNIYTYPGNRCRYPQTSLGVTDPNQTYWMRLINTLGMQLGINDSWASTMVSWDGITESTDIGTNKYIASQTRIGHLGENGTPDYILVNAGTNDIINNVTIGSIDDTDPSLIEDFSSLPVDTFSDAYRTLLARLMHTYPNARIVVLLPNFATGYGSKKQDTYCEIIKELCDMYGIPYLDMRVNGVTPFNKSTYLGDGVHYNAEGMLLVANELIRQFMTLI